MHSVSYNNHSQGQGLVFYMRPHEKKRHAVLRIFFILAVTKSLFEGDIVLSPFDLEFVDTREEGDVDGDLAPSRHKRNANRNRMILWHDKIVPYKFDPGLPGEISNTYRPIVISVQTDKPSLVKLWNFSVCVSVRCKVLNQKSFPQCLQGTLGLLSLGKEIKITRNKEKALKPVSFESTTS